MGTILKLNDLTKKYGNKVVVDNVNIEKERFSDSLVLTEPARVPQ